MPTTRNPPPYYAPRVLPRVNAAYHEDPVSENTSLIHGRGKYKKNVFARALFLQFLVAFLVIGGLAVFERQLWQQELTRRRQREDWWHREEEARQKLGLYWDTPVADSHCTAHNTREYWAHLLNTVPFEYNWLKACQDIPLVIHGKSLNTTRCYINPYTPGEVYGHWLVEFNEPLCSPYWDRFKDKGCTAEGSGRRRLEAHLEGVHEGEDEEKLCASAPYDFYGQHFDFPDSCVHYWGSNGIFGIWEINDSNC